MAFVNSRRPPKLTGSARLGGTKANASSKLAPAQMAASDKGWKKQSATAAQLKAIEARLAAMEAKRGGDAPSGFQSPVWLTSEPHLVKAADGREYAQTFSNDSEIGFARVLRVLASDPVAIETINERFGTVGVDPLAKQLGVTPAQLRNFGLRKGVDKSRSAYLATELVPKHFAVLVSDAYKLNETLSPMVQARLREKGFPVRVEPDAMDVEVMHATSEANPKAYAEYIARFHDELPDAQTHLHQGLPAAAINAHQAIALARVAETKTLIALAAASPFSGKALQFRDSALSTTFRPSGKGVEWRMGRASVYLKLNEFKEPVVSHDLEVRQWNDIAQGMDVLATTVTLAKNASRLRISEEGFGTRGHIDGYWGNIGGALEYAAAALKASPIEARRNVAKGLDALADEVAAVAMSDSTRAKIYKFLNKHDVYQLLNAEAFLLP